MCKHSRKNKTAIYGLPLHFSTMMIIITYYIAKLQVYFSCLELFGYFLKFSLLNYSNFASKHCFAHYFCSKQNHLPSKSDKKAPKVLTLPELSLSCKILNKFSFIVFRVSFCKSFQQKLLTRKFHSCVNVHRFCIFCKHHKHICRHLFFFA